MSNNNSNQLNVPEAREAMNRFKMECANDVDFQNHIKKKIPTCTQHLVIKCLSQIDRDI